MLTSVGRMTRESELRCDPNIKNHLNRRTRTKIQMRYGLGSFLSAQLLLLFFLSGCAAPAAYRAPIVKYQLASTVVIENSRLEYATENDRERDDFFAKALQNRQRLNLEIFNSDELRVLGGEGIEARMIALNALETHGELLLALASSDAPCRSRAQPIHWVKRLPACRRHLRARPRLISRTRPRDLRLLLIP